MNPVTKPNGFWKRAAQIASVLIPLLLLAAGYGRLNSQVQQNEDALELKANVGIVQLQYNTILDDLADIKAELQYLRTLAERQ